MPSRPNDGPSTISEMAAAGIYRSTYWLLGMLGTSAERRAFVQSRFPSASATSVAGVVRRVEEAQAFVGEYVAGVADLSPGRLTSDPTRAATGQYVYYSQVRFEREYRDSTGVTKRTVDYRPVTFGSSEPLSPEEIREQSLRDFRRQWGDADEDKYKINGTIVSGSEETTILAIFRGG